MRKSVFASLAVMLVGVAVVSPVVLSEILPCGRSIPDDTWIDLFLKVPIGLLFLADDDETTYAPGYNEQAFRSLKPGNSREKVMAVLGAPLLLKDLTDDRVGWYYSEPGRRSQDYLVRVLILDTYGRVLDRRAGCCLD